MERILLVIAVFWSIAGVGCAFFLTSARRISNRYIPLFVAGVSALFLFAFAGLGFFAGVSALVAFSGVYLTLAVTVTLGAGVAYFLRTRMPEGIARDGSMFHVGKNAIRLLTILLLIEVFIPNSATYARVFKNAPTTALSPGEATVTGATAYTAEDGTIRYRLNPGASHVVLEWENVRVPMGTIGLFFDTDVESVSYSVDFSDATNAAYRNGLIKGTVYPSAAFTRYLVTETSGEIGKLRVTLTPAGKASDDRDLTFGDNAVTLNVQIPYHFSPVRVSIVFFLAFLLMLLLTGKPFREETVLHPAAARGALIATLAGLGIFSVVLCMFRSSGWYADWHMTTGNQMTKELVDAFRAGQLHLIEEPTEGLLSLENPYDWSQRSALGGRILWDHLLYNGHYYSYYGIAPVLLLFLPYNLLTGFYFPSHFAVLLFGVAGIVFLGLVWHTFVKKFFPELPLGMYVGGLWMLEAVSGVFYCYAVTNFYEIARSAGFCFVTMGAYFLLSSNVVGKGKISYVRLVLSATALSLAVLSRPTEAVWCVVAVLFLGFGLCKRLRNLRETEPEKGKRVRGVVLYLVAALLPYVLIGGVQMLYNKLRFGSVLEFGIQYSLTINDFTRAEFGFRSAMIGFWNYLFAPPSFTDTFPFLTSSFTKLDLNGYYFNATPNNAVGLLFRALPVFTLFAAPKVLAGIEDRGTRIRTAVLGTAVAVAAPTIIIFSIWESGYCVHYGMDFFWEMTIAALGLLGLIWRRCRNRQVREILYRGFAISVLLSVLVNFALYFRFFDANSGDIGYALFGRLFAFWVS